MWNVYLYMELIRMRTKQILLFGLVTCSLTGNMACKDADMKKRCVLIMYV